MTISYNLIHKPWIPCLTLEDEVIELGLLGMLVQAHRLREIADPSPLVVIALHRLALAVLHRLFGPKTYSAWGELWEEGEWPGEPLAAYFEEWRDRFDLFHPEKPFFQADDDRVKPFVPEWLQQLYSKL